jgi:hypothetical protein
VAETDVAIARVRDRFYVGMAAACLAVGVVGFAPTYWAPMARGTVDVSPITHLHGIVFYFWLMFFVAQSGLVASGRTAFHRELGLLGVSLATGMLFMGLGVAVHRIRELEAAGFGDMGRRFAVVPVTAISFFAIVFAMAIRNVRKPAIHKRLMLVATVALLQAAVARWTRLLLAPAQPDAGAVAVPQSVGVTVLPGILSDLLIVVAMIHDRRTTGRVHPVYWLAGGALLALQLLRVPLSSTDAWVQVTYWLTALAP